MQALLADVIVAVHLAYVLFVIVAELLIVLGGFLKWGWVRNPWFRLVHLAMILVVVVEALLQFECPLTTWERQLRQAAGQAYGDMSFVGGLLHDILFVDASQQVLTTCYVAFGALVVASWVCVTPRPLLARPAEAG